MRAWLHEKKGLSEATIKAAGLGFNPVDSYKPRDSWGLEPALKDDGAEQLQWLPAGLVIPHLIGDTVRRLRIRRDNPGDGARYVVVSGSSSAPMAWNLERETAVIVESELDGLLLNQVAGDLIGVVSIGSATAKPDRITHEALTNTLIILVALDSDGTGAKAAFTFWLPTYGPKAKRWPTVLGKDPSDALKRLDLRSWVVTGIFDKEERFERFCIQTVDGGMSDAEALMSMGPIV